MAGATIDDKALAHTEAIILSMTPLERENPQILNASRKKRIAAGCGALCTPTCDAVVAPVAPGQNGRAGATNDLAMQGSAAIGVGVFTPRRTTGSVHAVALVCVAAAATGIAGDWAHEYLYRHGR